jgi:hypothetical protein
VISLRLFLGEVCPFKSLLRLLAQLALHAEDVRINPLLNDLAVTQSKNGHFRDFNSVARRWLA